MMRYSCQYMYVVDPEVTRIFEDDGDYDRAEYLRRTVKGVTTPTTPADSVCVDMTTRECRSGIIVTVFSSIALSR